MAFRAKKKKKPNCKPNVIPILDAVFIFIFFLLIVVLQVSSETSLHFFDTRNLGKA